MKKIPFFIIALAFTTICFANQKVVKHENQVQEVKIDDFLLKRKIAIGCFSNETLDGKGILCNKESDPLLKQVFDILSAKLISTGKIIPLERQNIDKIMEEPKSSGNQRFQEVGAEYLITGSVTESGTRNSGDRNTSSEIKNQTVEVTVGISLIDVFSAQIIFSEKVKGEVVNNSPMKTSSGDLNDTDVTLRGEAIAMAISKLMGNIITNCLSRPWKTYIITQDLNGIYISGGKSQGIKIDDIFNVIENGKIVENPQTGIKMELPGKNVGKIKIHYVGGETQENEFCMGSLIEGSIDLDSINNYYILEMNR